MKMATYNSTSKKAEEFINHEKILETLEYADAHKDDLEMMNQILEKGRKYQGLSYKEAMTLLECEDPAIIQQIFALGKEIKEHFYGNRIVMFAPLYLSNYCINRCVYCPYHGQNKHIPRKKLSQEDIRQEVIKTIEQLPAIEYDVLHKIYVQYKEFYEIADAMKKSYSWVTTIHGRGLAKVQKIIDNSEVG